LTPFIHLGWAVQLFERPLRKTVFVVISTLVALIFGLMVLIGLQPAAAQKQLSLCDECREQLEKLCTECSEVMGSYGVDCGKVLSRLICFQKVPVSRWCGEYYVDGELVMVRDDGQKAGYVSLLDERLEVEFCPNGPASQTCLSSISGEARWKKTIRSSGGQWQFKFKIPGSLGSSYKLAIDGIVQRDRSTSGLQTFLDTFSADLPKGNHTIQVEYFWSGIYSFAEFRMTFSGAVVLTPGVIPKAPTALTATALPNRAVVKLAWTDNTTVEDGFEIVRRSGTDEWKLLRINPISKSLPANSTSFDDTDHLTKGTTYEYRVRATNLTGTSAYSNIAKVTTSSVPQAPSEMTARTISVGSHVISVQVCWINKSEYLQQELQRSVDGSQWSHVEYFDGCKTQYYESSPEPGSKREYRVRGSNEWGNSEWSNTATITIPKLEPSDQRLTDWKTFIENNTVYVKLDSATADRGALKKGATYTVKYSKVGDADNFKVTGINARTGEIVTRTYSNVKFDDYQLSLWGRKYRFDGDGKVWDIHLTQEELAGTLLKNINQPSLISSLQNPDAETGNKTGWVVSSFDLSGTWVGGKAIITQTGDKLTVKMPGRHTFQGSYISANKIKVDFTDDRPCCTGTVVSADRIKWSNGSVWVKKK
jgi:hypothetical protein